jgi:hypothetical protein
MPVHVTIARPPRGIVAAFDFTENRHVPPAALSSILEQLHGLQQRRNALLAHEKAIVE